MKHINWLVDEVLHFDDREEAKNAIQTFGLVESNELQNKMKNNRIYI